MSIVRIEKGQSKLLKIVELGVWVNVREIEIK